MTVPGFPTGKALVGLIGSGIGASLTPALQEEEARCHGLRLHYQLIDLERHGSGAQDLPMLLSAARIMGFAGLNITFPCKQAVVPLLDDLSEEARAIGAVNTVVHRDGRLVGHNTDASGWRWGFEQTLPRADLARVVLVGAGGAGSAIGHALMRMSTGRLFVFDRQPEQARALAHDLARRHGADRVSWVDELEGPMAEATGLVHATPTGMASHPGMPLPARLLRPACWVAEIVYFPLRTELLEAARAAGCATVDGGTMAVGQAIGAFELFTGLAANAQRMREHFGRLLDGL
ncbi:MAG: shikimate dehydrogenase [Burkholderiaceae bacterium]|nr:shikimate dehydrogenase [Burkholderiaceae bacterium]